MTIAALRLRLGLSLSLLLAGWSAAAGVAAEKPKPEKGKPDDINARFRDPDVAQSIKSFEGEGRDIFQKRNELVGVCDLRPGMDVADVGAGTGLFTRLFAAKVAPGKVYAVDIAKKFIDHIEKTARERYGYIQPGDRVYKLVPTEPRSN